MAAATVASNAWGVIVLHRQQLEPLRYTAKDNVAAIPVSITIHCTLVMSTVRPMLHQAQPRLVAFDENLQGACNPAQIRHDTCYGRLIPVDTSPSQVDSPLPR